MMPRPQTAEEELALVAAPLAAAKAALAAQMDEARWAAITADARGVPETVIARTLVVNRMTVRKWLGKG